MAAYTGAVVPGSVSGLQAATLTNRNARTVPNAPTGLTATRGVSQVALTWTAPAFNGGSTVTGYSVYYSTSATGPWTLFASGVTTTSSTVTGLTNGTPYWFRVTATNLMGEGAAVTTATSTTPGTVPGVPQTFTGTPGQYQVALNWTAPASNGGYTITGYTVFQATSATGPWTVVEAGIAGTSKTVTGLTVGTTYWFRVTATNTLGDSNPASTSGIKPGGVFHRGGTATFTYDAQATPTGVSSTAATLTFTLPADATPTGTAPVGADALFEFTADGDPEGVSQTDANLTYMFRSFQRGVVHPGLRPLTYTFTSTAAATVRLHSGARPDTATFHLTAEADITADSATDMPPGGMMSPLTGQVLIAADSTRVADMRAKFGSTPKPITGLMRVSPRMPDPRAVKHRMGRPASHEFTPDTVIRQELGWVRVVVNGHDVTFLRGVPCEVTSIVEQEPFGWARAEIRFPQLTAFEDDRYGHGAWFADGAPVTITLRDKHGDRLEDLFHGFLIEGTATVTDSDPGVTYTALGSLFSADLVLAQPDIAVKQVDLADRLAERLNNAPCRRYQHLDRPASVGIPNRDRGSWQPILSGFVQDALADAVTDDGLHQWTISMNRRRPVLHLKDRETVHHTVTLGTPGVTVDLRRDVSQATTTVYGYGVDSNNRAWANLQLPNADERSDGINFPLADPGAHLTVGSTDAGTTTGDGVSRLQARLRKSGLQLSVTGTYDSRTASAVSAYQRSRGLDVTGTVGGQTWSWLFTGGGEGILTGAYYAPLASIGRVERYTYNALGQIVGENPNFDPLRVRVERWHGYPDGFSKQDAFRSARAEVDKDRNPGWSGTIALKVDPEHTTRWSVHAGQNILVKGLFAMSRLAGGDPVETATPRSMLLHINEVSRAADGTTTLTVDTEAHDLVTLDAITARDKENSNPARRTGGPKRRSELPPSTPVIDSELQGWIDRMPVEARKWVVAKVPVGSDGTIVGVDFKTDAPTRFVVAMFAGSVTPADLDRFTKRTSPLQWINENKGIRPFPGDEATAEELDLYGWIDTIGGPGEAAGYWPGSQSEGGDITGVHKDKSISLPFESLASPLIWVAVWAPEPCFFTGKLLLAPQR